MNTATTEKRLETWIPKLALPALTALSVLLFLSDASLIYVLGVAACAAGVGVFLAFGKRLALKGEEERRYSSDAWLWTSAVLLAAAMICWILRPDPYVVPLTYFALSACSSGALAAYALSGGNGWRTVVLATASSLTYIITANLMFPGVLGSDTWSHFYLTTHLGSVGTSSLAGLVPVLGRGYSLMHLLLNQVMTITHLSYKLSAIIFWSVPQMASTVVLVYLCGKRLLGERSGAVAAVLVANAGWVLLFGQWAIPNGAGVPLCLLLVLCAIVAYQTGNYSWFVCASPLILTVSILTSVVVTVWVAGTIAVAGVVLALRRWQLLAVSAAALTVTFVWFVSTSMFAAVAPNITIAPSTLPTVSPAVTSAPATAVSGTTPAASVTVTSSTTAAPPTAIAATPLTNHMSILSEMAVNSSGSLLLATLSSAGALLMFRKSIVAKTWVLFCAVIPLIGILPRIFGISLIEHRWYYLAEPFLSVPAALLLVRLSSGKLLMAVTSVGVTVLVLLSILSTPTNTTNRALSPNLTVRYGLTTGEMEGADVAVQHGITRIGADPLYALYLNSATGYVGNVSWVDKQILDGDFSQLRIPLLLRSALCTEPFGYGSGSVYRLGFDPAIRAQEQGYVLEWSNGEISLLVRGDPYEPVAALRVNK